MSVPLRTAAPYSLFFLALTSAHAQSVSDTVPTLDEVVVTGEKVERKLRHTAAAVTVKSATELENEVHRASVTESLADVPNVVFPDTVSAPVIRGQDTQGPNFGASAFLGGTLPRASINVDGHYLGHNEMVFGSYSFWDLDSIEVFRGPQTTSQGANSIAGAMIVKTKDPTFHREGAAQLEAGSLNMRRASAMFSTPLIEDELALRLAADRFSRDTFIDYVSPRFVKGASDQDFMSMNLRGKLLWQPKSLPGLKAKLTFSHSKSNRPTSETASPPYEDNNNATASMPSFDQKANTVVGDVTYQINGGVQFINRMEFTKLDVHRVSEPAANGNADIYQKNFSNDARFVFRNGDSPWSGVAGMFVSRVAGDDTLNNRGISSFDDVKKSQGVYGELTRRLGERWHLTGGLRYQRDEVQRSGTTPYARTALDYGQTFHSWLPKLSLAYDVNREWTVGGLVSKGYNPGGTGLSFANAAYMPFKPETVMNYELFTRGTLMDGRMSLEANVFYADIKNSQRLQPDYLNGLLYGMVVVNADKARAMGAEISTSWRATRALRLRGSLGLLDTEIKSGVHAGNQFAKSPKHTLSVGVDWLAGPGLKVSADLRHVGSTKSDDANAPAYRVGSYTLVNARLSYAPASWRTVELFAFVNNLFDARRPTWKYDDRSVGGIVASMVAPRHFGVGVRASF
ncbi:TonB-dependent receptor [Ottowia sp. GY511]|uniref:TonB-dependent receptor n=1 Tax=Ottowia flava TaxID=2675430 RepID=A0ABW4KS27_9BURK|nr:TonB-dependent receptor [Ottowia sp. GY511]TXK31021.1 TonB-dependent receptor [Ottowia sp. GY511]